MTCCNVRPPPTLIIIRTANCLDHIWDFSDNTYLHNLSHLRTLQRQGKIGLLGLTNTDAAHLQLLLDSGFHIATNQLPVNVIDRRLTRGRLSKLCVERDVGVLAYGTLLGGFLSEKWVGAPEPADITKLDGSLRKYLRFIWAAGGWTPFQRVLNALDVIAKRHNVTISTVATRYVLDVPSVKAVIVGSRLSSHSTDYIDRNLAAFDLRLTEEDRALIAEAQEGLTDIPGDCGDEYRRPPFLTASGDTSDHLDEVDHTKHVREAIAQGKRVEYSSGSTWEPIAVSAVSRKRGAKLTEQGYCRAVRTGDVIRVSGTTANSPIKELPCIGGASPASQTVYILDTIENALKALGGSLSDVVRTRIMVRDEAVCEEVSRAHGRMFASAGVKPANTFVTAGLIGEEMLVEIEAEAVVGCGQKGTLSI